VQRNEMEAHAQEKVGCGNRAWPIRGMYGIINRGGRIFSILKIAVAKIHNYDRLVDTSMPVDCCGGIGRVGVDKIEK